MYEIREATFKPHRTDDLRPEAVPFIGKVLSVQYAWTMDAEDRWPGKRAYMVAYGTPGEHIGWLPEMDLVFE